jgi:hypothetical protein
MASGISFAASLRKAQMYCAVSECSSGAFLDEMISEPADEGRHGLAVINVIDKNRIVGNPLQSPVPPARSRALVS